MNIEQCPLGLRVKVTSSGVTGEVVGHTVLFQQDCPATMALVKLDKGGYLKPGFYVSIVLVQVAYLEAI